MAEDTKPVKDGKETTEHSQTKSAGLLSFLAVLLGAIISLGPSFLERLQPESNAYVILGGVVAIAGIVMKALVSLGYIKGRTDVKVAASMAPKDGAK